MKRTDPIGKSLIAQVIMMVALVFVEPAGAQDEVPRSCIDCHKNAARVIEKGSFQELLTNSVHQGMDCTDCHESLSMDELDVASPKPHGDAVPLVACGECHEDEAVIYVNHGRLVVGTNADIPTCSSCHGTHDIIPSSDKRSRVHPGNLRATCNACHTDVNIIKDHHVLRDEPIKLYEGSVHGWIPEDGSGVAATCADCHSADSENGKPTAHRILSAADPASTVHHFNVPNTCGKCHPGAAEDYGAGIHGQLTRRGEMDAPVCTDCHGEHGIISAQNPRSPVSKARLATNTCEPCHASARLSERFGYTDGIPVVHIDGYHGLKSQAGDITVANCASCHGAHAILPSSDPDSSIHEDHLQGTCGACHPRISVALAQTPIHGPQVRAPEGWPDFFRRLYTVLIAVTIAVMLLHNGADWWRRCRRQLSKTTVKRFTPVEVAQHWVLMLAFIVLVITGFSLRHSEAEWVRFLFGWKGGFELRGAIHRVAAVAMMAVGLWHFAYLFTRRGRQWIRDIMPTSMDAHHVVENVKFFTGVSSKEPAYSRFSYKEKAEYWALAWGTLLMSATGVLLWFDNRFVAQWHLPKVFLDVALVVHYYEAWLALLAIVVWHVYETVFKPSVYPMNPSWLKGTMPRSVYQEEHPLGPRLPDESTREVITDSSKDDEVSSPHHLA